MNKVFLQLLCPFGEFHHWRGNQIVDEIACEQMIKNSKSFFKKCNIPIYFKHPDDLYSDPSKLEKRILGYCHDIIMSNDGIYIQCEYTKSGIRKLRKCKHLSPRWKMQYLGDGNYRPVELISLGITDKPNIEYSGNFVTANNCKELEDKFLI